MELLISDKEHAMLKTQTPFSDEVTSVEFFADTRLLVLIFSNTAQGQGDDQLVEVEVAEELIPYLTKSSRILVAVVDDFDQPVQGFDVPLISMGL